MSDHALVPRRLLAAFAVAGLALLAGATPAAADPAKPTDYRSEVTSIEPGVEGITVQVAGGDGFLDVEAASGHEVIVEGYRGEPYLRFEPDGTVSRNLRSEATYINDDRYGAAAANAPTDLEPTDEPVWEQVATGGRYAWHDHRIHWMSPDRPPDRQAGDVVFDDWQVPIVVDGTPAVVHGTLRWEKAISPLPWFGLAVVVGAALVAAARGRKVAVAAAGLLVASLGAVGVSAVENASIPPGAGGSVLTVAIPALGAAAALVALARSRTPAGAIGGLASVALLAGWALLRVAVLLKPVLPTDLAPNLDRAGTALAIGAAIAGAVVVVRSGTLRLPELVDDDPVPA